MMHCLEEFRNLLKKLKRETGADPLAYLSMDGEHLIFRMTWYLKGNEYGLESPSDVKIGDKIFAEQELIENFIRIIKNKVNNSRYR